MNKTHNAHERKRKTASRRKKELALALAVSLWIATGGAASAQETTVASDYSGDVYGNHDNTGWSNYNEAPNNNTVTVNEGVTVSKGVYGSLGTENAAAEGNKVIINGTVTGNVRGGIAKSNANNNHVTINGTVSGDVYGGNGGEYGFATGNHVTINGTAGQDVYGAWATHDATENHVTVSNGSVRGNVCGGQSYNGNATNNQITLNGATINGFVQGGRTGQSAGAGNWVKGNTLILSGANTVAGNVQNFETIKLSDALAWKAGATVLDATGTNHLFTNQGNSGIDKMTLDISAAANLKNATPGTMTLLSAPNKSDVFDGFKLKDFDNTETTLSTEGTPVFSGAASNAKNGVTLVYDAAHTVKLEGSNNKVTYNVAVANPVKTVTFGEITWDTSTAARTMTTEGLTFNGTTVIDASKLAFATPEAIAKDASMTLLAGATGLTSSNTVTGGTGKTVAVDYTDEKGIKFDATASGTVGVDSGAVKYTVDSVALNKATLGSFAWGADPDSLPDGWTASAATTIDATNFEYTGIADRSVAKGTTSTILNAPGLTKDSKVKGGANIEVAVEDTNEERIKFEATAKGHVEVNEEETVPKVQYVVDSVALKNVDLGGWNGEASGVPQDWTGSQVTVSTGNFNVPALAAGQSRDILTTSVANYFGTVSGDRKYSSETFENSEAGVTLSGNHIGGVKVEAYGEAANAKLTYYAETMDTTAIALGEMTWGTARDASGMAYNYANVTDANLNVSGLTFTNPEDVTGTTTLLAANDTLPAGLADVAKPISYQYNPVAGVTVEGAINGSVSKNGANIVYTATENKANKLTFGDVEWKDSGALMARPANITFAGADVDTTHINFTNIQSLDAGRKMTLVSDFGNSVGTITGAKYKVGSTLEGTGKASLSGSDLIFTAETGTTQEQTHNTVMGATVGMAALSAGNDFIGSATEGLALASNVGADGVSSFAQMGGGSMRQETGSHVDTHTWNAILALGHQNKKERGTMEYGAFFEYGTGNYTTHNDDSQRGDGSARYTGGGLLAKWTANHGFYVEGSFRAGTVHDDADNLLRDFAGNGYSYDTNANYFGAHLGVGKEIPLANGNTVDVYGKYFYNRKNGVSFNAGGHYDLDAVTSQIIRIGARYTIKRDKWDFYAGAAYEHELDGKATGTAGGLAIRGADPSGASFRGEIGATMKPGENSPWSLDLNVTGFAGKKQGVSGGVSVSFTF